jgi:hypothetical protein
MVFNEAAASHVSLNSILAHSTTSPDSNVFIFVGIAIVSTLQSSLAIFQFCSSSHAILRRPMLNRQFLICNTPAAHQAPQHSILSIWII